MKAEDLYKPIFTRSNGAPSRRQYLIGGTFCAVMAGVALFWTVAIDHRDWAGALIFGGLALGSFRLAHRASAASSAEAVPPNKRLEPTRRKE